MAIIHCGFVPHQNKSINQTAGFGRNNPADDSITKSQPRPITKPPSSMLNLQLTNKTPIHIFKLVALCKPMLTQFFMGDQAP